MAKKIFSKTETTIVEHGATTTSASEEKKLNDIAPKEVGMLDMVIAFDTTGLMAYQGCSSASSRSHSSSVQGQ